MSNIDPIRIYTIYGLVHPVENYIYVGMTSSRRLSAVFSDHIHDRVSRTSGYFNTTDERPSLHLLDIVEANRSEAYRIVVAYTAVFMDSGFWSLSPDGTLFHAAHLKLETAELVKKIRQEPLPDLLERTRLKKPTDGDRPLEKKEVLQGPLTQINIRIAIKDKDQFSRYCKNHHINQRQGFSLLLDKTLNGEESHHLDLVRQLQAKNQKLTTENEKLRKKLAVATGAALPEKVQRQLDLLNIHKEGVLAYLDETLPTELPGAPLKRSSYRKFMRWLTPDEAYIYPPEDGVMVLRLEAILWGKAIHRACFLAGTGDDGKHYRLRYYMKKDTFAGITLDDKRYVRQGTRWIVGFQRAKDGAMELLFGMPLPELSSTIDVVHEIPSEPERKISLDDRIRAIEGK